MSKQKYKLEEAEYFLNLMQMKLNQESIEEFKYMLSAFLSAARSILQYTEKYAENNKRSNDYRLLLNGKFTFRYFKHKRDFNVHTAPILTVKKFYLTVKLRIKVRVQVNPSQVKHHADGTIEIIKDCPPIEKPIPTESLSNPSVTTNKISIYFKDRKSNKEIMKLCHQYIADLKTFIIEAQRISLIQ
jgi:hypothetical protein